MSFSTLKRKVSGEEEITKKKQKCANLFTLTNLHLGTKNDKINRIFPLVLIMGEQSTGKSSLATALISFIMGEDLNLLPMNRERCTKRLTKMIFSTATKIAQMISSPLKEDISIVNIQKRLEKEFAAFPEDDVNYSMEKAISFSIPAPKDLTLVDAPGPVFTFGGDMSTYCGRILKENAKGPTCVLFTIRPDKQDIDAYSSASSLSTVLCASENAELLRETTVIIVAPYMDLVVKDKKEAHMLRKIENYMRMVEKSPAKVFFAFVQLVPGDAPVEVTKKVGEEEIIVSEVHVASKAREAEETLFQTNDVFSKVMNRSNFLFGVKRLINFIEEYQTSSIKNVKVLESLKGVLNQKIMDINDILPIIEKSHTSADLGNSLYEKFSEKSKVQEEARDIGIEIVYALAKIVGNKYMNIRDSLLAKKIQQSRLFSPVDTTGEVDIIANFNKQEETTTSFLSELSARENEITEIAMNYLIKQLQKMFSHYNNIKDLSQVFDDVIEMVRNKFTDKFHDDMKRVFMRQFYNSILPKNASGEVETIFQGFPVLLADAALDHLDNTNLVQTIIHRITPLLVHLSKEIVCNSNMLREQMAFTIREVFSNKKNIDLPRYRESLNLERTALKADLLIVEEEINDLAIPVPPVKGEEQEQKKEV